MRIYITPRSHAILKLQAAIESRPMTDLVAQMCEQLPAAEIIEHQSELDSRGDDNDNGPPDPGVC